MLELKYMCFHHQIVGFNIRFREHQQPFQLNLAIISYPPYINSVHNLSALGPEITLTSHSFLSQP